MNLEYSILNQYSESELLDYETKLFDAFCEKYNSNVQLYSRIWELPGGNRMRPAIGYDKQLVYIAKDNSEIVWSISVNISTDGKMQFEDMGFSVDEKEKAHGIGEVLALFSVKNHRVNPYKSASIFVDGFCFNDLRKKGIRKVYTTCSGTHFKFYLKMGFKLVEQKVVLGEDKYLIEKIL